MQLSRASHIGVVGLTALVLSGPACWEPKATLTAEGTPAAAEPLPPNGEAPFPPAYRSPASDRNTILLQVQFDVMWVELPIHAIRHSIKVWNHVDELQLPPQQCALLARNGLRIGVANVDAWPAILTLLQANGARSDQRKHAVQSGHPLTLDMGTIADGETIFTYNARERLVGDTFPAGHKYVYIDYDVHADDPSRVTLRVMLEIHALSPSRRWTVDPDTFPEKPDYLGKVFADLAATFVVEEDQFLVIGPSPQAGTEHLLGGKFFEQVAGGRRYEILIFATPQLYQTRFAEP
jgi:hypothetical protein